MGPEISGYLNADKNDEDYLEGDDVIRIMKSYGIHLRNGPPFDNITKYTRYASRGVVKLDNIPYKITQQEIIMFLNKRGCKNLIKKHCDGYPVHIIMEKVTGETMECFVEFPSVELAGECVARCVAHEFNGTLPKIGDRIIYVELSNQAELMRRVFPRARLVKFDDETSEPTILAKDQEDMGWTNGFRGFFTMEEMFALVNFALKPGRTPFSNDSSQRVYESMITTLYKFPWPSTAMYSIGARNAVYSAVYRQVAILTNKVEMVDAPVPTQKTLFEGDKFEVVVSQDLPYNPNVHREVGLTQGLLLDLLFAGINVPSFSQLQKVALCAAAGPFGAGIIMRPFAEHWPFQTLEPARDASDQAIKFWLELFDAGWQKREARGQPTTFEKYILFGRNRIGFIVAEWTKEGLELPFNIANQLEYAAMMVYIDEACQHWCYERMLNVIDFDTMTLPRFVREIIKINPMPLTLDDSVANRPIDPQKIKFPVNLHIPDPRRVNTSGYYPINRQIVRFIPKKFVLNPATAPEFVPAAYQTRNSITSSGSSGFTQGSVVTVASDSDESKKSEFKQHRSDTAQYKGHTNLPVFTNPWNASPSAIPNTMTSARAQSYGSNGHAAFPLNTNTKPSAGRTFSNGQPSPQSVSTPRELSSADESPIFHLPQLFNTADEDYGGAKLPPVGTSASMPSARAGRCGPSNPGGHLKLSPSKSFAIDTEKSEGQGRGEGKDVLHDPSIAGTANVTSSTATKAAKNETASMDVPAKQDTGPTIKYNGHTALHSTNTTSVALPTATATAAMAGPPPPVTNAPRASQKQTLAQHQQRTPDPKGRLMAAELWARIGRNFAQDLQ